ncbi:MAG: mannose-1-phosphate guanylyltransferase/mannose-6-phosphate isomerase [Hyphomicrobium sp.]|jgi:mannose-1-phosphate guanylyltransferase/mannose-6-phosphate isomerase|nr:mannose-1-phosphate guanylyltransferase/mannose-6-phosphate isomerase [Hyphomicrobium sp.]
MSTIFPVILSGGSGTRLWPLSRAMYPKQFIRFFDGQNASFLGATLQRLKADAGFAPPILLCNNDHRFLVQEEVERAGIQPRAIILEPIARNTAPAIAVAALAALRENPGAVLAVMPSDHVVQDEARFVEGIRRAAKVASTGRLVLFGIKPSEAHTGYGYIRQGAPLEGFNGGAYAVEAFYEKPDKETAQRYLASGDYFWNSGIFVLNARTYLEEIARLEPQILEAARGALARASDDLGFVRLDKASFAASPNISIDYAVMEKTTSAAMLPLDVGWNDVGSWTSLWEIAPRDDKGNYIHGEAVLEDTAGCYVHTEKSIVSTIGLKDLVIVDTPDALLVADKSRTQDVSKIVQRLKKSNRKEQEQHLRNYRPWGYFETLNIGPRFQVKLLHVKPGGKLSMQMHHHRSEHWIVVQGTAKVVIGDIEKLVRENESVYIFATQWHRLENPGKVPVEIIEVQIGSYLGEDDIMRTDDIYHRAPEETK